MMDGVSQIDIRVRGGLKMIRKKQNINEETEEVKEEKKNEDEIIDGDANIVETRVIVVQPVDTIRNEDNSDILSKYINPKAGCICCTLPNIAVKINEAYLNGNTYTEIIEQFKDEIASFGKKISQQVLSEHFTEHFNFKGAAIAEYNRKKFLEQSDGHQMKNIFDALVKKKIDDLELLDLAMTQQVKRLKELEDLKTERIQDGRTYSIDNIIMKQEMIMNNLQTQLLNKLKIWQNAQFQSKKMELIDRHLKFLDHKTANFLGIDVNAFSSDPNLSIEAEKLYLKTVIENIIKRVKSALELALKLSADDKVHYFKELNRQFIGIEEEINKEFQELVKNLGK